MARALPQPADMVPTTFRLPALAVALVFAACTVETSRSPGSQGSSTPSLASEPTAAAQPMGTPSPTSTPNAVWSADATHFDATVKGGGPPVAPAAQHECVVTDDAFSYDAASGILGWKRCVGANDPGVQNHYESSSKVLDATAKQQLLTALGALTATSSTQLIADLSYATLVVSSSSGQTTWYDPSQGGHCAQAPVCAQGIDRLASVLQALAR